MAKRTIGKARLDLLEKVRVVGMIKAGGWYGRKANTDRVVLWDSGFSSVWGSGQGDHQILQSCKVTRLNICLNAHSLPSVLPKYASYLRT